MLIFVMIITLENSNFLKIYKKTKISWVLPGHLTLHDFKRANTFQHWT